MANKKKKRFTQADYIKANRKASREAEIEAHGHPVNYQKIYISKKIYNRKRQEGWSKEL